MIDFSIEMLEQVLAEARRPVGHFDERPSQATLLTYLTHACFHIRGLTARAEAAEAVAKLRDAEAVRLQAGWDSAMATVESLETGHKYEVASAAEANRARTEANKQCDAAIANQGFAIRRADALEARVKELEGMLVEWQDSAVSASTRAEQALARAGMLSEAVEKITMACAPDSRGHRARTALDDITAVVMDLHPDQAVEQLLARLRAAEDGMRAVVGGVSKMARTPQLWAAIDAWRAAGGTDEP